MARSPHLYAATFALIINEKSQILLMQRANTGYMDGYWDMPAGHIEDGETAIQSMTHECLEELGITIDITEKSIFHVIHRLSTDRQYIDVGIYITQRTGDPYIAEPHKCSGLERYALDNLPANLTPSTRQFVTAYQNKIFYSEIVL